MTLRFSNVAFFLLVCLFLYAKYMILISDSYWKIVDNEWYYLYYQRLRVAAWSEIISVQFDSIGAIEPLSAVFYKTLSYFVNPREIPFFSSLIYTLLFISIPRRNTMQFFVYFPFIYLGFYEFILFDITQRLKVAAILCLFCLLFLRKRIHRWIWLPLTAHLSVIFVMIPVTFFANKSIRFSYVIMGLVLILATYNDPLVGRFLENKLNFFSSMKPYLTYTYFLLPLSIGLYLSFGTSSCLRGIALIIFITLIFVILGRSRLLMLFYFLFIYVYFFTCYQFPKFKGFKYDTGDILFCSFLFVNFAKSWLVVQFYLNGTFVV